MKASMPPAQIADRTALHARWGRGLFDDMVIAGWLKPCVHKPNECVPRPFFSMRDVLACEERMLAGEYPRKEASV